MKTDSPQFGKLILWMKSRDYPKLGAFFRLEYLDADFWIEKKYRIYLPQINLATRKKEIQDDFVDPLFLRRGVDVQKMQNRLGAFLGNLSLIQDDEDFKRKIDQLNKDLQIMAPGMTKLFSWVFDKDETRPGFMIQDEIEKQTAALENLWENLKTIHDEKLYATKFDGWKKGLDKRDKDFLSKRSKEPHGKKLAMVNKSIEDILTWLKSARGKPGRHPEPFNVFCYHLINKCTQRKIVPDIEKGGRRYLDKKDGQHKLERNWPLILFLLLDVHLHSAPLSWLEKFISKNKNKAAVDALRILKTRLWNSYKNFPPKKGWRFKKEETNKEEAGLRKLIVKDDGSLKIVNL